MPTKQDLNVALSFNSKSILSNSSIQLIGKHCNLIFPSAASAIVSWFLIFSWSQIFSWPSFNECKSDKTSFSKTSVTTPLKKITILNYYIKQSYKIFILLLPMIAGAEFGGVGGDGDGGGDGDANNRLGEYGAW